MPVFRCARPRTSIEQQRCAIDAGAMGFARWRRGGDTRSRRCDATCGKQWTCSLSGGVATALLTGASPRRAVRGGGTGSNAASQSSVAKSNFIFPDRSRVMSLRRVRSLPAVALILAIAAGASAQQQTGNLYGTVTDDQGAPLAGATVEVTGIGAPQRQVSDSSGQYRFLGLSPGSYQMRVELAGFSTVEQPNLVIAVGRNTTVDVALAAAVEDVITVTAESPLLDERKIATGTSITAMELERVPTARDPWSLLNQTPGVIVDRINVGGNESGQQSVFVGLGANTDAVTWAVDGVDITDMAALSSPTYFDFDAFEELQLTTGGSDVTVSTAGVTVNVVTRRGTNEWRGSGRYFLADGEYQSDPDISGSEAGRNNNGPGGSLRVQDLRTFVPNRIEEVVDEGLEIGGPILKDRLWIWGAYGDNDIKNIVGGQLDRTILENYNGKLNAQLGDANSAIAQWSRGDKIKDGRGAGSARAPETTTDQSGPTETSKLEDTHVFSPNFFATGLYSFIDGGFALVPKGGVDADIYQDENGVYHGSFYFLDNNRDVTQYRLEASTFFNTGAVANELKFGAGHREFENTTVFGYSGGKIVFHCSNQACPPGFDTAVKFIRDADTTLTVDYDHLWLQDTVTWSNMTANVGLRYQKEEGINAASGVEGVAVGSRTIFPALQFPGNDPGFDFTSLQPRLGFTYALGSERRTLVRGNFSRFAEQLGSTYVAAINPVANSYGYGAFNDLNRNTVLDPAEAGTISIQRYANFDPANPTALSSTNRVDPNLDPMLTDELGVSIEHAFLPELVLGAAATYRHVTDITDAQTLVVQGGTVRVARRDDWLPESQVVAGRTVDYFVLRPGVEFAGGTLWTNGDREQDYLGLALTLNKRLSNRWMMRGNISWNDWTWSVPSSYFGPNDPTDFGTGLGVGNVPPQPAASGDRDGDVVAERSSGSGSKTNVYLNSEWSANLNGLYQVAPERSWGFNVGANLSVRQGYPSPHFISVAGSDGNPRSVQVTPEVDSVRNDDVMTLDLRLEKELVFGSFVPTFSLDLFNVFNENTVLQRERNQASTAANFVRETVSPRVLRFGLRLSWN
jgi:hypothetical protein